MPFQKLQFRPGVDRETTNYANEGGWFDIDKVRFRSGSPQKIGGWMSISDTSVYTFVGVNRTLWNWVTTDLANLLAVGTNQKYYIENGGQYFDITPIVDNDTLGADPFATTNTLMLVIVTHTGHGAAPGQYVIFSGASAVGGLDMNDEFEIISVVDSDTYTVLNTAAATSTTTGGGAAVDADYLLTPGNAIYTVGTGWGAGVWSRGTWGSAASVGVGQQLVLWTQDNFGENLVLAQRGGTPYYWEADTAAYARAISLEAASTTAGWDGTFVPNATNQVLASGIQRFTIFFGANPYDPGDANTAFDPMLVRWSDQENEFDWVPTTSNQSGEQRLATGSALVQAQTTRQEILVWTDTTLYSMQYLGPPFVWGFTTLMDNISIMSPNSAVTVSNVTYWMGIDKFYMYSGRVQTMPCNVREYVFGDFNKDQAFQVVGGSNEGFSEVWWFYPSAGSSVNDRYVLFNYLDNVWYFGTLNRTAILDSALRQFPMASHSIQMSYLDSNINASVASLTVINAASYPESGVVFIDSEQIAYTANNGTALTGLTRGYNNTTAASHAQYARVVYNVANQVIYHEIGVDDGSVNPPVAIEAYIQSSDFDIGDGHNFGFVDTMLPDVTFVGSTAGTPVVYIRLRPRVNSGSAYTSSNTPSVELTVPIPVEQYTGQVYTRVRGRQMAFRIESTALGVAWQLGSPRINVRQDGRR